MNFGVPDFNSLQVRNFENHQFLEVPLTHKSSKCRVTHRSAQTVNQYPHKGFTKLPDYVAIAHSGRQKGCRSTPS